MKSAFFIALIAVSLVAAGCYSTELVTTQDLEQSNNHDIMVTTRDGYRYDFDAKDYSVHRDSSGQATIRGAGRTFQRASTQVSRFKGDIPVDSVERVVRTEIQPFPSLLAGAAVMGAIWFIIMISSTRISIG